MTTAESAERQPADRSAYRFPRSARLLTPATFSAVFEQRRARKGQWFHLHVGARKDTASLSSAGDSADGKPVNAAAPAIQARLGVAVPKKLLKTAVHRNLIKRIARETFRRVRGGLEARDYVLRLSSRINPRQQPIDRQAVARDIAALLAAVSVRKRPAGESSTSC